MPNKDRKMFNITKKLHIKIIMMYHPIPIRNVKSKILKIQNADGNIEKQVSSFIVGQSTKWCFGRQLSSFLSI